MSDAAAHCGVRSAAGGETVRLACAGASAEVALHGAQVLSWHAGGVERLYLSPRAERAPGTAIRGGIPVCFPQFNRRGPAPGLPKHGFARLVRWRWDESASGASSGTAVARFTLADDAASRAAWPQAFAAALEVRLGADTLAVALEVGNPGGAPLAFTAALHSYLAVADLAALRLCGLDGCPEWDAVADASGRCPGPIAIAGEFDRVYEAAAEPLVLEDRGRRLHIAQKGFSDTVVWNPGATLCAGLPDMPSDGYRRMLCVEAAQVDVPVTLAPGASWRGAQRLSAGA